MIRKIGLLAALASGLMLAGCVDDYGGGGYGVYSSGSYPQGYGRYGYGYGDGYYPYGSGYYGGGAYGRRPGYRPVPVPRGRYDGWRGHDRGDGNRGGYRNPGRWNGDGNRPGGWNNGDNRPDRGNSGAMVPRSPAPGGAGISGNSHMGWGREGRAADPGGNSHRGWGRGRR